MNGANSNEEIKDFYAEKAENGRNEMNSNAPEMQEDAGKGRGKNRREEARKGERRGYNLLPMNIAKAREKGRMDIGKARI